MISIHTECLLLDNNKVISDQLYNLIIVLSICWIRIKLWMISSYLYYCFILLWLLFIIPFMNMIVFVWDSWYVLSYSLSLNFVYNINKTHSDSLVGIILFVIILSMTLELYPSLDIHVLLSFINVFIYVFKDIFVALYCL